MRSCHVIRFGTLFSISGDACVRLRHKNLAAWLLDAARSGRHAVSAEALSAGHLALGRHLMALALQLHQQPSMPHLLATADVRRAYTLRYAMQHLSLALSATAEQSADGVIGKAAGSAPGQAEEAGSGGHAPGRAEEAGKLLMSGVASWDLIGRVFEAGYGVDAVRALDRAVRLLRSPNLRSSLLLGSPTILRSSPPLQHFNGSIADDDDEDKQQPASASYPSAAAGMASDDTGGSDDPSAAAGADGPGGRGDSSGAGGPFAYLCEALRWLRLCFDEFEARPTELEAITLRLCPVR